ncbi:D-alanyl-D-alanine carboxypeptidase family protein [Intestinibacillus sp. Marseille-P6563]|uniref:D-alanyl-D-alanine carboxypeptidase family protein n=1 Tax=Intestinibacillus sp. Marseille-P6563 TaxID=2364792 RepID=UPI000F04E1A0|nr:D-alanyl-D-alanine carboxypeptidase family protein [Intestinibacillus sp. Marseille-P6563]
MKKLLSLALCAVLLHMNAAALPAMGELTAKSAALYDASGQMLYEMNAEESLQPASVTKIMTLLLAMEALDRGEVQLDTMVTGSAHAASMGGTQIWLKEGEQLPFDEMLKAIAVGSANDCAVAVAEHLCGSEEAFVQKMNERAKELGCTSTTFVNANGLDADGQKTLTSARDLALISAELLRHPKILDYTTIWMDTIRNGEFSLANTNKMLRSYNGLVGLKTGYISEAGFCISAVAERDGMTLIATVMGAPTKEDRTADATALLDYGFANFAPYTPDLSAALTPLRVRMGQKETVTLEAGEIQPVVVAKEEASNVTTETHLPDAVDAPIEAGQELGSVTVKSGDKTLLTIPLAAAEAVDRLRFGDVYQSFLRAALMKQAG